MNDLSTETAGGSAAPNGAGAGGPAQTGGMGNGSSSQPAQPWYSTAAGITDEDRAYIENKGWREGPQNILKSYRDLERVMGDKARAVLLPNAGDPEGRTKFFQEHFGTPDKPEAYKLPSDLAPENLNISAESVGFLQKMAHKVGATPDQFQEFVKTYNEEIGQAQAADVERYNGEVNQVKRKLEQELGQEYGEMVARGNLAMRKLGLNGDEVTAISEAIGIERATRLLMNMGGTLAQDTPVGMNGQGTKGSFVTDGARAREQISRIQRGDDPNFKKALLDKGHPDHRNVNEQWRAWQKAANS
jgi:hypothetical protein